MYQIGATTALLWQGVRTGRTPLLRRTAVNPTRTPGRVVVGVTAESDRHPRRGVAHAGVPPGSW